MPVKGEIPTDIPQPHRRMTRQGDQMAECRLVRKLTTGIRHKPACHAASLHHPAGPPDTWTVAVPAP